MKLSEKIELRKKLRISRKIQRLVDFIIEKAPTIDGAFLSPEQYKALRQLHSYCTIFQFKAEFISNYPVTYFDNTFRLSEVESKALSNLRKACRHSFCSGSFRVKYTPFGVYILTEDKECASDTASDLKGEKL